MLKIKKYLKQTISLLIAVMLIFVDIAAIGIFNIQNCYASGIKYSVGNSTFTLSYSGNGMEAWITGWSGTDKDIVIPTTDSRGTPIVAIQKGTFKDCATINSVYIPSSVYVYKNVFSGCSNLTAINVEDGNISAKSIDGVLFQLQGKNTTLIYYPPSKAGETYEIPDEATDIAMGAFDGAKNIKTIKCSSKINEVSLLVFGDMKNLTTVEIPGNVTKIYTEYYGVNSNHTVQNINVSENNSVYSSADGLLLSKDKKSLIMCPKGRIGTCIIPDSVQEIDEMAFSCCDKIKEITITKNVKTIKGYAFDSCKSLEKVNIESGVEIIESNAFSSCELLKSVHIPSSVTQIGNCAFGYQSIMGGDIDINELRYPEFVISGTSGSAAEKYAKDNKFEFSSLDDIRLFALTPIRYLELNSQSEVLATLYSGDDFSSEQGEFSFVVENESVIDIVDIKNTDDGALARISAKGVGTTTLTVTSTKTGKCVYVPITVGMTYYNYAADNIPTCYVDDSEMCNFIVSGMYVDNFKKENISDEEYLITMDIYNSTSAIGTVDIYDCNNKLIRSSQINRVEGRNLTSFEDTFYGIYNFYKDVKENGMYSYKNSTYSAETNIEIKVPKGGHFIITNNINESKTCCIYNFVDLYVNSLEKHLDVVFSIDFKQEVNKKVLEILWEKIKSGEFTTEYFSELTLELSKEISVSNAQQILHDITTKTSAIIAELNIDHEKIVRDVAISTACSFAEDIFEKSAGFAGLALSSMFVVGDYFNLVTQIVHIQKCSDNGVVRIDTMDNENRLYDNGISLKLDNSYDYVFRSFAVTEGEDYNLAKEALGNIGKAGKFVLYDLYLMKNDLSSQPTENVKVAIPLPENYNPDKAMVYRIEKDGKYTDMKAYAEGNYLVFETNHFSLYAVTTKKVENINYIIFIIAGIVLFLGVCGIGIVFVKKRYRKC